MRKTKPVYLFLALVFFGLGFLAGRYFTQKEIASRPTFDQEGFVKSVQKTVTGRILEVKKSSLVLTKNNNQFEIEISPEARISILTQAPVGEAPARTATGGGLVLPPPEVTRQASLGDLRVGDRVTISMVETPDGKRVGKTVSVERK